MGEAKRNVAAAPAVRPASEMRAEIARWRKVRDDHARAHRGLEALAASLIIQTLAWTLGEAPSPATRNRAE